MRATDPAEYIGAPLNEVIGALRSGLFGALEDVNPLLDSITHKNDFYLVAHDFYEYAKAQLKVPTPFTKFRSTKLTKTNDSGPRWPC
jgi:hypothetical protein